MLIFQRFLLLASLVVLSGCQSVAHQDPLGRTTHAVPNECSWPRMDTPREPLMRATVAALEARNFVIRHTETQLGVISAERTTRLRGLGAVDRPWLGGNMLWGSFGRQPGVALGYGVRFGDDPRKVERLSVVIGETDVRVTRDSNVVDPDGYLIDARPDNRGPFCRELNESIDGYVRAMESQT